jgi:hypothetical protein
MSIAPLDLAKIPPELIAATIREASRDAEMTAGFLDALGQVPGLEWLAKKPVRLPADILLGIGASMRLLAWETQGIHVHRDAGLPSATEALVLVFRSYADPEAGSQIQALRARVSGLFFEQFAWTGGLEWGADVVLGGVNEDDLVDAMAKLLWDHRHGPVGEPNQQRGHHEET